jgi:hypothetical protein
MQDPAAFAPRLVAGQREDGVEQLACLLVVIQLVVDANGDVTVDLFRITCD